MSFTMYEKFDLYLMEGYTKEFISLENESQTIGEKYWFDEYWYEYGCDKAIEILSKFTQDDLNKLTKEIFSKSLDYQEKVIYCMENENNENELEFLLYMIKTTKNSMIFEACMESLIEFVKPETKLKFLNDDKFMVLITGGRGKQENSINRKNNIYKTIYEQFFEKLNSK